MEQPHEMVNRLERMGQQVRPRSLEKSIHANLAAGIDQGKEGGDRTVVTERQGNRIVSVEVLDSRRIEE